VESRIGEKMKVSELFEVEQRTIDAVPVDERHGKTGELAAVWFGMNCLPLTIVTGAVASTALGLTLWASLAAIGIGNLVGAIFMALHAAQGPKLGVPQMVQARGQFGSRGGILVALIAVVMFVGFFASNLVVAAQALGDQFPGAPTNLVLICFTAASFFITLFGYRLIRRVAAISAVLVGLLAVGLLVDIVVNGSLPPGITGNGDVTFASFMAMVSIGAVWQIAYAPYVSDYSRYMPADTGSRGAFLGTYFGSVTSSLLFMSLGALIGAAAVGEDALLGMKSLAGAFGGLSLLVLACASAFSNSINAYCSTLCSLTVAETFKPGWVPGVRARLFTAGGLHVVGAVIAIIGTGAFLTNYTNFVTLLLYALIPWTAINLLDYYVIRRGQYDVPSFFRSDGGIYGRWNRTSLSVYALGIIAEIPFMSTALYTGPVAKSIDGVDVAWIVGLLVACLAYYPLARTWTEPEAEHPADAENPQAAQRVPAESLEL